MDRKPRVQPTREEKWEIVQEGIKSGNVPETCRTYGIAPKLFHRWKDEAEQGTKGALLARFSRTALAVASSADVVWFCARNEAGTLY